MMVDKLSTLPSSKISELFGRLDDERMKAVDRALLLVVGLIWRASVIPLPATAPSRLCTYLFWRPIVRCSRIAAVLSWVPSTTGRRGPRRRSGPARSERPGAIPSAGHTTHRH